MKKSLLFLVFLFFTLQGNVLAVEELAPDYSLMSGGNLTVTVPDELIPDAPVLIPFSYLSSADDTFSEEEYLLWQFDNYLCPENIVNQYVSDSGNLYTINIPLYIPADFLNSAMKENSGYLNDLYNRFVEENPEYFYLIPESFSFNLYKQGNAYLTSIPAIIGYDFPDFDGSRESLTLLKTRYYELTNKIEEIADLIAFENMTDLDKLLLTHDYITDNSAYYLIETNVTNEDGTITTIKDYGDGYSHNAYGILINQLGVCQGYTYAYNAILKALDFPQENLRCVTSSDMNHIWNFVKLNDKWYHVDATWDDPTYANSDGIYDMNDKTTQRTRHSFFLISHDRNCELRPSYSGFDMYFNGYSENVKDMPTDTAFESGYIFNDFHIGSNSGIGNITYSNNTYILDSEQYISGINNGFIFHFNTLKSPEYAISQPYTVNNGYTVEQDINNIINSTVLILSCASTEDTTNVNFNYCFYDEKMRFTRTVQKNLTIRDLSVMTLKTPSSSNDYQFKLLCTSPDNFKPLSNTPTLKRGK